MLAIMKAVAVLTEIVITTSLAASSTVLDGTASRIVMWTAAAAGLAWFWRNVLTPLKKIMHRMAKGVESLEGMPEWRDKTDRHVEELERSIMRIGSGQDAMLRELGMEDMVRRTWEGEDQLRQRERDDPRR